MENDSKLYQVLKIMYNDWLRFFDTTEWEKRNPEEVKKVDEELRMELMN